MGNALGVGMMRALGLNMMLTAVVVMAVACQSGKVAQTMSGESILHVQICEQPGAATEETSPTLQTLLLTVEDVKGTYTIPHIQSSRDLRFSVQFSDPKVVTARADLLRKDTVVLTKTASPPDFAFSFDGLSPSEYTLHIRGMGPTAQTLCDTVVAPIGIGMVAAAIGDSITEGYYGHGYFQNDLHLRAGMFPVEAVSRNGRNYPQFSPTTGQHLPSVNCFQSWMTALNDLLSASWQQPVFVANEGWGGISSGGYLKMIREDANWRNRMRILKPQLWLIHLGVNDERAKVPSKDFAKNMDAIVDLLIHEYGAKPDNIFTARPCYDYFEGAPAVLAEYCKELDALVLRRGLRQGPDFLAAYSTDRNRWYGEDTVHPNIAGMERMAQLWHKAIVAGLPQGMK